MQATRKLKARSQTAGNRGDRRISNIKLLKKLELPETIIEIAKSEANCKNNQTKTTKNRLFSAIVQPKVINKTGNEKERNYFRMGEIMAKQRMESGGRTSKNKPSETRPPPPKQWRPDQNRGKQPRTGDDSSAYPVTGRRSPPAAWEPP